MARLQGRVRVHMPQCYGTCLKTSELAAMSYAFDDWGLDASMEEVRARLGKWMVTEEDEGFEAHALALFRWQAHHNVTYRAFVQALRIEPLEVSRVEDIPFMPVEMFKSHEVKSGEWATQHVFRSSGTTRTVQRAQHHLDAGGLAWYGRVARQAWTSQWGSSVDAWSWLGLLPGYLGREDASLLTMVSDFMTVADGSDEGMLMHDHGELMVRLTEWAGDPQRRPLVLFGVTWAVLDWLDALERNPSELDKVPWHCVTLMDTGGMKGRGVEPIREEVQSRIRGVLPELALSSEYGMTEMLSQGYALDGVHHTFPKWAMPLVRESRDPRSERLRDKVGRLDMVDLANVQSCAFLATKDAAKETDKGLVLLGRQDDAEVRGCSLLAAP